MELKPEQYVIFTQGLTKRYGHLTAVNEVNLAVKRGEVFGLVGPDGAGKTTTIQLLSGIMKPSSGKVVMAGKDITSNPELARNITGYMSQDFTLYEDLSVEENLEFFANLRYIPRDTRERRKKRMYQFSRLEPFKNRLAGQLSGGMKKKLALSCALIHHPDVLFLDEPSTGVDPISRVEFWKILYEFIKEGITIFISTPYLDEAERCSRVAFLHQGKIIACDSPSVLKETMQETIFQLLASPQEEGVKTLRREGFHNVQVFGNTIHITGEHGPDRIVQTLEENEVRVEQVSQVFPTLDDVYISTIKKEESDHKNMLDRAWIPFFVSDIGREAIVISEIRKKFDSFIAVDGVNLQIERKEVFGLLGPNGAGKTTLIRMLCGLLLPSSGDARIAGYSISREKYRVRSMIGYMSQKFSLYPDLTVRQNLDLYASVYGIRGKEKARSLNWIIEIAGLEGREKSLTRELSGGLKQRLALGCAVIHQPPVLFLDEPTAGVDPLSRKDFWDIIYRLSEEGITVLVTTHFMDEAEHCHRLGLMYGGRLIALGTPEELKKGLEGDLFQINTSSPMEAYEELEEMPFVSRVALFGTSLHVMVEKGIGEEVILKLLKERGIDTLEAKKIIPSLEDVFIGYLKRDIEK